MDTVSAFIETVGRQGFAEQTAFTQQSISRAICVARDIAVPDQLFRWADRCGPAQRRGVSTA